MLHLQILWWFFIMSNYLTCISGKLVLKKMGYIVQDQLPSPRINSAALPPPPSGPMLVPYSAGNHLQIRLQPQLPAARREDQNLEQKPFISDSRHFNSYHGYKPVNPAFYGSYNPIDNAYYLPKPNFHHDYNENEIGFNRYVSKDPNFSGFKPSRHDPYFIPSHNPLKFKENEIDAFYQRSKRHRNKNKNFDPYGNAKRKRKESKKDRQKFRRLPEPDFGLDQPVQDEYGFSNSHERSEEIEVDRPTRDYYYKYYKNKEKQSQRPFKPLPTQPIKINLTPGPYFDNDINSREREEAEKDLYFKNLLEIEEDHENKDIFEFDQVRHRPPYDSTEDKSSSEEKMFKNEFFRDSSEERLVDKYLSNLNSDKNIFETDDSSENMSDKNKYRYLTREVGFRHNNDDHSSSEEQSSMFQKLRNNHDKDKFNLRENSEEQNFGQSSEEENSAEISQFKFIVQDKLQDPVDSKSKEKKKKKKMKSMRILKEEKELLLSQRRLAAALYNNLPKTDDYAVSYYNKGQGSEFEYGYEVGVNHGLGYSYQKRTGHE